MIVQNKETKKQYQMTSKEWGQLGAKYQKLFAVIVSDDNDFNQVLIAEEKPMETHTNETKPKPKKKKNDKN